MPPAGSAPPGAPVRHPQDPEPVRSSKAPAVFALGLVAVLTGPFVGGLVPATIALVLAGQARREAWVAGGYLTGGVGCAAVCDWPGSASSWRRPPSWWR